MCDLNFFGRIRPKEDYLVFSKINFQEVRLKPISAEQVSKNSHTICDLNRGTKLQLSCGTTRFNSWNETIEFHLLVLKIVIFTSDKVERYDGKKKHQGRLRLSTKISLIHGTLERWVTMPEILGESDEVHIFNKCLTGYVLCPQILDIMRL